MDDENKIASMSIARVAGPLPTKEALSNPFFAAIWDAIKGWDIRRSPGESYHAATGNDAHRIYLKVSAVLNELDDDD